MAYRRAAVATAAAVAAAAVGPGQAADAPPPGASASAEEESLLPLPSFATRDFVAKYDRLTRAKCYTPREDTGCGVHPKLRNVTRVDCVAGDVAHAGNVCTKSRYDRLEDGSNARCSAGAADRVLSAWQQPRLP